MSHVRFFKPLRPLGALITAVCLFAPAALAEDIHSNGTGGGTWSDPTSWRSRKVPSPTDTAIIARGDTILFDRNDSDKITVNQISVDPKGVLSFKPGGGRMVLTLSDTLEAYGTVRLDATKAPASDHLEIRFAGDKPEKRALKLLQGGAIIAYGKEGLAEGNRNVVIASKSLPPPPPPPPQLDKDGKPVPVPAPAPVNEVIATITAGVTNSVDLQRAHFANVVFNATGIDNTGAKNNERLNVIDSKFTGLAQLNFTGCDSPVIAGCTFIFSANPHVNYAGLTISGSPLADIRSNTFTGNYERCIQGQSQSDTTVVGNIFTGNYYGLVWHGANTMIKGNIARNCRVGFNFNSATGVIEDTIADSCGIAGFELNTCELQFINTAVINTPENARSLSLTATANVPMLNCSLDPAKIALPKTPPHKDAKGNPLPWVVAQSYFVLRIKGAVPAGSCVEIATANPAVPLAPGAMDMNIRNNFAPLTSSNTTPLPQTLKCIILRSWSIGVDGKTEPPPSYNVKLLGPPPKPGADEPVLKTVPTQPADAWFRKNPNDANPTLEIAYP